MRLKWGCRARTSCSRDARGEPRFDGQTCKPERRMDAEEEGRRAGAGAGAALILALRERARCLMSC